MSIKKPSPSHTHQRVPADSKVWHRLPAARLRLRVKGCSYGDHSDSERVAGCPASCSACVDSKRRTSSKADSRDAHMSSESRLTNNSVPGREIAIVFFPLSRSPSHFRKTTYPSSSSLCTSFNSSGVFMAIRMIQLLGYQDRTTHRLLRGILGCRNHLAIQGSSCQPAPHGCSEPSG